MVKYLALVGFSFFVVVGQFLFKKSAQTLFTGSIKDQSPMEFVGAVAFNPWLWAALVLYGVLTVLWIVILRSVPLTVAYSFVALGFVFVPLMAWSVFGEAIRLPYMIGTALILSGIAVIVWWAEQPLNL